MFKQRVTHPSRTSGGFMHFLRKHFYVLGLLCLAVVLTACPAGDNGDNGGNGDDDNTPPTIGTLQLQNAADSNVTAAKIIVLQVTAQDDKELAKVEFFQGGTKIGEDPTSPYEQSVNLTRDDNGNLSFTAKAVDKGENESALSNAVSVTVNIQVATLLRPSKSSAIAITGDNDLLVQVNPENDSISTFNANTGEKLKEVPVGDEPVAVVIGPDDDTAFVLNRADGTLSKITDLDGNPDEADTLELGSEPTGLALSPTGKLLVVTEFGESRVALIDTEAMRELDSIEVPNPRGVAISNDNDQDDDDEKVVVTEFYGRRISDEKEAKDDGRIGAVRIFDLGASSLSEADTVLFNPEPDANFAPTTITSPNQLYNVAIAGDKFFVVATATSPDGAASFNQNIRQLVLVGKVSTGEKLSVINLSALIKAQVEDSKQLFMADIVDLDLVGDSILYLASRGADGFQRAFIKSDGSVELGIKDVKQVDLLTAQKCQNPIGVVTSHDVSDNKAAFVNCWVSRSMVTVDLGSQVAVKSTSSSTPPAGLDAKVNLGRRFYFTGRARWSNEAWSSCGSCHPDGLSDNVTWRFGAGPRQTISMDGNFSHGPGPQIQRVLNWSGERDDIHDFERNTRGVSGGKGAITIAGAGTCGNFDGNTPPGEQRVGLNPADATDPNGLKVQLGIPVSEIQDNTGNNLCTVQLTGGKDWDDIEEFVKTIRPVTGLRFLSSASVSRGRDLFEQGNCAACHGGEGWTVSRLFYEPSETRNAELAAEDFDGGKLIQAEQTLSQPIEPAQLRCVLRDVNTFGVFNNTAATDVLELKPPNAQGVQGRSQGEFSGFNVPSLFGLAASAPYLHHGQADTLEALFTSEAYRDHLIAGNAVFNNGQPLSNGDAEDLANFLRSIDETTEPFDIPAGADKCAQFEN
jgi:DNA-binding beta-propeller fold protein YncE/cytochrome c peroxidase